MRLAGLAGDHGRNLRHLHERAPGGAELAAVIAETDDAQVLRWARSAGIPTAVLEPSDGRDAPVAAELDAHDVELVCLDGFGGSLTDADLRVLPTAVVLHRSLLPSFPGPDPVRDALEAGVTVTGCTVQVISEWHDDATERGTIVTQEPVPIYSDDDRERLLERLRVDGEYRAYPRAVRWLATGSVTVDRTADRFEVTADTGGRFPERRFANHERRRELRYGENPHQAAAVYADGPRHGPSVVDATQLNPDAKALSYNNYNDADAALGLVREFDRPAAAVIKHANPAGCAVAQNVADAYDRALRTDAMSAFGGIVGLNRRCDVAAAERIVDSYKEVVVAPAYADEAVEVLREREDLRLLAVGPFDADDEPGTVEQSLAGGRLVQDRDGQRVTVDELEVVSAREPTETELKTMAFAWPVVKHTMSNAIVLATDTETVGVGMGQVSRVDAVRLAAMKADEHADGKGPEGAVLASDAFFPFPDGLEVAAEAGVAAVVQPGGSVNDDAVIEAADEHDLAMTFTGQRAFRHG